MVHYCVAKKKPTEECDPNYEDISDLRSRGNIDVMKNVAYDYVQH